MINFDLNKPETLFIPVHIEQMMSVAMDENLFREILYHGYKMSLTEISIQEGVPIMIKINNLVFPITRSPINASVLLRMVSILHSASQGDDSAYQQVMHGTPANTTYMFKVLNQETQERKPVRYRFNVIRDQEISASITMRLNNDEIKTLEQIGQTEDGVIYRNMFPMKGLNFITGAVDSGKTTLIYACLAHFIKNSPRSAFIHTYESPIEGDLKGYARKHNILNKVVSQTPVPGGVKTFSEAIENSLRRNSDIILLGEIRTRAEIEAVISGVNSTGKLLMGTLHTDSTAMAIDRLIHGLHSSNEGEMRAKIFDLLSALNMIVSQKLLSTVDKKRVAVHEQLIIDMPLRKHLQSLPPEKITSEIEKIMIDGKKTMVHMAKNFLDEGRISNEVYSEFKSSFSYGDIL